ncbi:MAG: hypothetical protein P4M07_01285 [Xanthobacteraceae bacterium]|nr:hypothetical protein [Xanthobacteraceae bacterium]
MQTVEITDAIDVRRCKRALYFGRPVTLEREGAVVSGLVRAIRQDPEHGDRYVATIVVSRTAA